MSDRKLMLICAPMTSRSGYGNHARDLIKSFMMHDKYDIKIADVPWGDCPRTALDKNNEEDKKMLDLIIKGPELPRQPDIYVDIRIPNEFQLNGKFNIGITAGVETTAVSQKWLDGCNKMDLVIVPSNHSKNGFVNSVYDKINQLPNGQQQKVGEVRLEKPMEVLFEGSDEEIFKPLSKDEIDSEFFDWLNTEVPEKFAFLFVGQWVKGGYGEDRKDVGRMLKVFYESFANKKKKPALILKTSGATFSLLDYEECKRKVKEVKKHFPKDFDLPNVYLLHGDMNSKELNYLYNHPKVKAMISFTHGEGYGRPLQEATMTGLPVIASSWSGQLDFLNGNYCELVPGTLNQIPPGAVWDDIVIPESQWFTIDEKEAYTRLTNAFENPEILKKKGKDLMNINRNKFTLNKMSDELDKIMEKYTKDLPTQVGLNLPKLKTKPNNLPDIKLPKLKKQTEMVNG
tara:strand:+ start:1915 stop:3285 length:1371 start_codon:yes stop_codon:yes gene_type:complete